MSNLVTHAENELKLLGGSNDEIQQEMNKDILQMVKMFAGQGHSGFSAGYALGLLKRLLAFKPITALTGSKEEWSEPFDPQGTVQNKRFGSVFKMSDGTAYDIDAVALNYGNETSTWNRGGIRYRIKFPYNPRENSFVLHLPKEYEDKTNEELIAYVKQHKNDSEEMADLAEHLFDGSKS